MISIIKLLSLTTIACTMLRQATMYHQLENHLLISFLSARAIVLLAKLVVVLQFYLVLGKRKNSI
jgi:hypothetical protein